MGSLLPLVELAECQGCVTRRIGVLWRGARRTAKRIRRLAGQIGTQLEGFGIIGLEGTRRLKKGGPQAGRDPRGIGVIHLCQVTKQLCRLLILACMVERNGGIVAIVTLCVLGGARCGGSIGVSSLCVFAALIETLGDTGPGAPWRNVQGCDRVRV